MTITYKSRSLQRHGDRYPRCLLTLLFGLLAVAPAAYGIANPQHSVAPAPPAVLSADALRELVAPVALYPDELLAIVLPASTYPLQIVAAARYRGDDGSDSTAEPDETWDESVVALLNYPEALHLLNDDLQWTWSLGQAVMDQQEDVLAAISAYRAEARAAGNLRSDDKQVVSVEAEQVRISGTNPEVIYVPYYDPHEVTVRQPLRVYHYYPRAYPVYYYPYAGWHRFYDAPFWGINSAFVLSWNGLYLSHRRHDHHQHPFYGRQYNRRHYRSTHHYTGRRAQRASRHRIHSERHAYRNQAHRPQTSTRWQPDKLWSGDRPRAHTQQSHSGRSESYRQPGHRQSQHRQSQHRKSQHRKSKHRQPHATRERVAVQSPSTRERHPRRSPQVRADANPSVQATRPARQQSPRTGLARPPRDTQAPAGRSSQPSIAQRSDGGQRAPRASRAPSSKSEGRQASRLHHDRRPDTRAPGRPERQRR